MKSTFKVGDKVRVLDTHYEPTLQGKLGVLVGITEWNTLLVEFTGFKEGHDGYGVTVPRDGKTNRWHFGTWKDTLELVTAVDLNSLNVGDRVRLLESTYGRGKAGDTGTVVLVDNEHVRVGFDEEFPEAGYNTDNGWNFWLNGLDGMSDEGSLELIEKKEKPVENTLKVGDKVVGVKDYDGGSTIGLIGEIIEDDGTCVPYLVRFNGFKEGHGDGHNEWWVQKDAIERFVEPVCESLKNTLKVGDRVVSLIASCKLSKGQVGTVAGTSDHGVTASFDNWTGGWGPDSDCWYLYHKEVKLYEEPPVSKVEYAFEVGDKVIGVKTVDYEDITGLVGKVVGIEPWDTHQPYLVRFDGFNQGHGPDNNKWYVAESDIKLCVEPEAYAPIPEGDFLDGIGALIWELTKLIVKEANPLVPVKPVRSSRSSVSPGAKTILKHLISRGSISPVEAFSSYGTLRLAARIHELRQDGVTIKTEIRGDAAGHRYARYTLA